jgi:hypothetical protein
MPLSVSQVRALDREPDHDPALQPDDGTAPARLGTLLANVGDSATIVATADADATYGTEERDLINELKANFNALAAAVADLARE